MRLLAGCAPRRSRVKANAAFTLTAVITIALAIGANTSIFSLLNALTMRQLPVTSPEQLVQVVTVSPPGWKDDSQFRCFGNSRAVKRFSSVIGWYGDTVLNVEANGGHGRPLLSAPPVTFIPNLV